MIVNWRVWITSWVLPQACASVVVRERRCTGVGEKFVLPKPLKFFTIDFSSSFVCMYRNMGSCTRTKAHKKKKLEVP